MTHYYNPNIPLESALELFDDPHIRYEIIEDYWAATIGNIALLPKDPSDDSVLPVPL